MTYFKTTTGPGIYDKIMTKDGLEACTYEPSIYIDDKDVTDSTYELQPGNIKRVLLEFYGSLNDKDGDFLAEFYFKALGQVTLDRDGRGVHFQIDDQLRPDGYEVQQRLKEGELDAWSLEKTLDRCKYRDLEGSELADELNGQLHLSEYEIELLG